MAIAILRRRPPSELLPSKAAEGLCKGFEGLSLRAYPDPASERAKSKTGVGSGDPWTIGWGHTGPEVHEGLMWTLAQCDQAFAEDLAEAAHKVRDAITVPLTQGEFDALTSMAFNLKRFPPPSLKACLNGGVTDKGKVMEPGSYGSAILEFPRNCRAVGKPMKGLYRRRLAEACVFNDLPWENACSISVIKFELRPDGEIDTDATTTLEDTLMRARLDTSRPPDTSATLTKPWSELVPQPKPEASVTIIEDKDELVLTTPAAPVSVPAPAAGQPVSYPQPETPAAPAKPLPTPASLGSGQAEAKPVAIGPNSPPAPQAPPVPVAPPAPPVKAAPPPEPPPPPLPPPKDPLPVDLTDPKDMLLSRRFWGLAVTAIGTTHVIPTDWSKWMANETTREFVSWIAVVLVGVILYQWGKVKAKRPLK